MNFYRLYNTDKLTWGDYGSILISGITARLPDKDGLLHIKRTGPFVPPISLSGLDDIVVTDAFKNQLSHSGLSGYTFRPVIKERIVHLDWEKWDRAAEEPAEYPATGEPESYILERPHSPETAQAVGELWEVCLGQHASIEKVPRDPAEWGLVKWSPIDITSDIYLVLSSWDGTDIFRATNVGFVYVSERARNWLEQTVPDWVSFEPVRTR